MIKTLSWKQCLLVVLLGVYLLYVGLSYLYLPGRLKELVETDVAELIGRELTVDAIHFNPFALSLQATGLAVADTSGTSLLAWESLTVDLGLWRSLLTLSVAIEELSLDRPQVNIERGKNGFNFADIVDRFSPQQDESQKGAESESGEVESASSGLALRVGELAINQGLVRYAETGGKQPAVSVLDDITVTFDDLYFATGEEHLNPLQVEAVFSDGGDVQLSGEYRVAPLLFDIKVQAHGIQLKSFKSFVANFAPLHLSNGVLSLHGDVQLEQEGKAINVKLADGGLAVENFVLDDELAEPQLLRIDRVAVDGVNVDLLQKQASVTEARVTGVNAHQWLDEQGKLRFEHILAQALVDNAGRESQPEAGQKKVTEPAPWQWHIDRAAIESSRLSFTDLGAAADKQHRLEQILLDFRDVSLSKEKPVNLTVKALLDGESELLLKGAVFLSPLNVDVSYSLAGFNIAAFSEYLEKFSHATVAQGSLALSGEASVNIEGMKSLKVSSRLGIKDLQLNDSRNGASFLRFAAFEADGIRVDGGQQQLLIDTVRLQSPQLSAEIASQGMNLATLIKPGGEAENKSENEAAAIQTSQKKKTEDGADQLADENRWGLNLASLKVTDGTLLLSDQSVSPEFTAGLYDMTLSLQDFGEAPAKFKLTGQLDRYAPLELEGSLAPLSEQPGFAFLSTISGVELPPLSPYSATYIGNQMKSGKLNLELDYSLKERKLRGKNKVLAENFYLGDKVKSDKATTAPVGLGLALLRDLNGNIDLNVGVSGDLDDPGFSVAGVIAKAFLNVIVKAVASPFTLLGSLVEGEEDMGKLEFAPGLAELSPAHHRQLQHLVDALIKKPVLVLKVRGNASRAADQSALQQQLVKSTVAAARKISIEELDRSAGDAHWWDLAANRRQLRTMNQALALDSIAARQQRLAAKQPELESSAALESAVYRAVLDDISAREIIAEADLLALASARALSIKQHLVDELGFDHQRIETQKAQAAQLKGRVVKLGLSTR